MNRNSWILKRGGMCMKKALGDCLRDASKYIKLERWGVEHLSSISSEQGVTKNKAWQ